MFNHKTTHRGIGFQPVSLCCVSLCILQVLTQPALAHDPNPANIAATPEPRELLVPFSDLHLLLGGQTRRVFMTRDEFKDLKQQAKQPVDEPLPQKVALLSAKYDAQLEQGRAGLSGVYEIEVLADGLHALPLNLSGVGIRAAEMDEKPAALVMAEGNQIQLIVQGRGMHKLTLDMVMPVTTQAAQQSLTWNVPVPPATQFHLSVPGNVELKSGAPVIKRRVDSEAGVTHFDLLPTNGPMSLVMSLNNRRLRDETLLLARAVLISEITQGYQRLHANLSMHVLHGAADEFRIGVPKDYEITQVSTPLLARWSVESSDQVDSGKVLVIKLRELSANRVVINLRADRQNTELLDWQMPKLQPLNVAGFSSVVGVLVEQRIVSQALEASNLIPIDNQVLTAALPASVLVKEAGAPPVRPLVCYYAAEADYALKTNFAVQSAELKVTTNLLLTLNDRGLEVDGGFALLPTSEKLFTIDFTLPANWSVDSVRSDDGSPLTFERYAVDNGWRIRVQLPGGLRPGIAKNVLFHAVQTPDGWLSNWTEQSIALPQIALSRAVEINETGAIAVRGLDDLKVLPAATTGLIVISDQEKSQYGCAQLPVSLAWRYSDADWQGTLKVTRAVPRVTGRVLSFLQISPDALTAHYELNYDVDQARTQRLLFSIPATTPAELSIHGLGDTVVKESSQQVNGDRRLWTVQLAENKTGKLRLAVDFTQPKTVADLSNLKLPDVRTESVVYQSGLIAVEGHAELDVNVREYPRAVDMGELIDAEYQVGKRLLGVFSYVGNDVLVSIAGQLRSIHGLPSTIVQRAELVTLIGTGGVSQTAARFLLRTKAEYLELRLPESGQLWSISVDGIPAMPERQADRLVVALKRASAERLRDVQVVYEHPIDWLGLRGKVQLLAPSLWQRAERDSASRPVPLADLKWEAVLPAGYRLAHSDGSMTIDTPSIDEPLFAQWINYFSSVGRSRSKTMTNDFETSSFTVNEQAPASAPQAYPMDSIQQFGATLPPSQMLPAQMPQAVTPNQSLWAIEGLRCLAIDLTPAKLGETLSFSSLGLDPIVSLTLINQSRWQWLGAAIGLALFVVGLTRVRNHWRSRLRFIVLAVLVACLLPLVTDWTMEFKPIVNAVIVGSVALLSMTVLAEAGRALRNRWSARTAKTIDDPSLVTPTSSTSVTLPSLIGFIAVGLTAPVWCDATALAQATQEAPKMVANEAELAALLQALPSATPITIPSDTIVVPYELEGAIPDGSTGDGSQKILVPYETYQQLWQAAHSDKPLKSQPPIVPYAWSAAQYNTVLGDQESLRITGQFRIEVYSEQSVTVPLTLDGGVLQSLTVDGQPARVQLVEVQPQAAAPPAQGQPQQAQVAGAIHPAPTATMLLLHLSGKGAKQVNFDVRMKIERRGGWRVISGRLPAAPATNLKLQVLQADSEVLLTGMSDRSLHTIEHADQTISTALPVDGLAQWQWRAKITEAAVDQGLSVDARTVFDIQEDGLRFAWQGNLEFRRGRRESFSLLVPGDYIVEKVLGANIRGWSVQKVGDQQQVTIDLLTAVSDRESLVVHLFRKLATAALADNSATEFGVPVISVPDAMLQKGQLSIRRSRLLDVRGGTLSGLSRIDGPDNSAWATDQFDVSPVALETFQAFQFSQVPYSYQLSARPARSRVQVTMQSLLSLSQLESSLESKLIVDVQERQLYQLKLSVPTNWKLQPPTIAVPYEWTHSSSDTEQTIEIVFSSGVSGTLPIILRGPLEVSLVAVDDGSLPPVALPKIVVQEIDKQVGDIVVTSDPAFAVRSEQLQNCETGLLGTASSWLAAAQQPLAQLLVHTNSADYSGQLRVTQRTPQVSSYSVSNIKLTDRAVEETLFFEFTIRTTGIRQISLIVPSTLANCRVRGPLIRNQTWTSTSTEAGAPVRLVIELQDEIMGQYSLILENDRAISSGAQTAPIPIIETGKTDHRFVTLENSGRDELVIDQNSGLERLQRGQAQWNVLAALLGGRTNEAFVVRDQTASPTLSFSTKDRTLVETVGARIGIAQTVMVVDEQGTYRASQEYRVENRTEQFLEIELPEGAQLWTVLVAGEPVKPMTGSGDLTTTAGPIATSSTAANGVGLRVRLPLVKTAAGDLDYAVVIKYGGKLPRPGALTKTRFPLVNTINVNVELSQVRLRLPPTMRWWNFGGSMTRVQNTDELTAGWLSFRTRQLNELTQMLSKSVDLDFSRARALSNIKQLGKEVEEYQSLATNAQGNEDLTRQLASNGAAWFEAQKELSKPSTVAPLETSTNRFKLNARFDSQQNVRSLNIANTPQSNFEQAAVSTAAAPNSAVTEFNAAWLAGNALKGALAGESDGEADKKNSAYDNGRIYNKSKVDAVVALGDVSASAQPIAPQIKAEAKDQVATNAPSKVAESESRSSQVYRYQQQLESNVANQASAGPRGGQTMGSGSSFGGFGTGRPSRGYVVPNASAASEPMNQAAMTQSVGGYLAMPDTPTAGPAIVQPGFLVSLDTDLPLRGDEYFFTTPRGATEITAQSVSSKSITRWAMIGMLLVFGSVIWFMLSRRKVV